MGEKIGSYRLVESEAVVLFECLSIILIMSFLSSPFLCKASFRWFCRCSLSEIVKALCTSELITDCFCAG